MSVENGEKEHPATTLFRDYIRINTVQPNPDYAKAMEFLSVQAKSLNLPYWTLECVMTWEGSDPALSTVILNSHTYVVLVFLESFSAIKLTVLGIAGG